MSLETFSVDQNNWSTNQPT